MSRTEADVLDKLLDPVGRCLTPEVARHLVALRASPDVQERLDALADRCTEARLTAQERVEYEAYIKAIDFISVLQAKARAILTAASPT